MVAHLRSICITQPLWSPTPFKVQAYFNIHVFEGQIDADVIDRWLNFLEGYFSVHDFSDREKIIFSLLNVAPHVKDWWESYREQEEEGEPSLFSTTPTWNSFRDSIKEQYYPILVEVTCCV